MRKKKTPASAQTAAPRTMLRSRTTMSYAFEVSVRNLIDEGVAASKPRRDLGLMIASALDSSGTRKRPAWTVSKREARR